MKLKRAREILSRFADRRILVVGDCMVDYWIWGKVTRISPEAPVPVVDIDRYSSTPGGAANVVHNLCSLGARAGIIGVVGRDVQGRTLRGMLKAQGADVAGLIADRDRPTTTKMRIIAHSQQVVRADHECRDVLSEAILQKLIRVATTGLEEYEAVLFSDYHKGVITDRVTGPFLKAASDAGIPTVAGPKPENTTLFPGVTVLAMNEKESKAATGIGSYHEDGAVEAARDLLKRLHPKAALITRGDRGMTLLETGHRPVHVPAHARQVYDVSGAGDTVVSVLTMALASGATAREAVILANCAAAVVVQKVGTATATIDEIIEAVRDNL